MSGFELYFSPDQQINKGLKMTGSPTMAVFKDKLYLAHQGADNNGELWYTSTENGVNWSQESQIHEGLRMTDSPSMAVFKDKLYLAHQGADNNGELWYTSTENGVNWSKDIQIHEGLRMTGSPSMAVFKEKLYLVHQGAYNNGELWYTTTENGVNWSQDTQIKGISITGSPSVLSTKDRLGIYYTDKNGYLLFIATDGDRWYDSHITHLKIIESSSQLHFNDVFCLSYRDYQTGNCWYETVIDKISYTSEIKNLGISGSPSLAVFNNKIILAHQGANNNGDLWYTMGNGFQVRKSVNKLSKSEKERYVKGVKLLKSEVNKTYGNTYDKYVSIHSNMDFMAIAHMSPAFLPWHRRFILTFEKDMRRVLNDSTFTLPYWDWSEDSVAPNPLNTPVWQDDFMGGDGDPVSSGPFTNDQWKTQNGGRLVRHRGVHTSSQTLPTPGDVRFAIKANPYDISPFDQNSPINQLGKSSFRNILEGFTDTDSSNPPNLHNRVHMWIGGSMSIVPTAPNDPVFFLHHCNVDRIWAMWQLKNPKEKIPYETTYPVDGARSGTNLFEPMKPWKTKPAQVLDFQALGYTFDNLTV